MYIFLKSNHIIQLYRYLLLWRVIIGESLLLKHSLDRNFKSSKLLATISYLRHFAWFQSRTDSAQASWTDSSHYAKLSIRLCLTSNPPSGPEPAAKWNAPLGSYFLSSESIGVTRKRARGGLREKIRPQTRLLAGSICKNGAPLASSVRDTPPDNPRTSQKAAGLNERNKRGPRSAIFAETSW